MPPSSPPTRRAGNAPPRGGYSGGANRPLYAIDFTAVACGKRIANTKRRVRWRFGFANPDAIAAGETGTACRGEEHDVTFVWSVTSGKRLILADGQEVHYSSSRSAVIDFSWTMRGNHVLKVIAHATAPMTAEPGFRQYDFFVDGRSFFTFPKVYRLGLTGGMGGKTVSPDVASSRVGGGSGRTMAEVGTRRSNSTNIAQIEAPHNHDEEEAYLREAIKASLEEQKHSEGKTTEKPKISAEAADLLIDFMDDWDATRNGAPAPAPAVIGSGNEWAVVPTPMSQSNNQWAVPSPASTNNQWSAPPPALSNQWAAPPPLDNGWAMPPPPAPAGQQQPDYGGGYGGGGFAASMAAPSNPFAPPAQQQQQQPPQQQQFQGFAAPPPPTPTADPFFASTPAYAQPPAPSAAAYGQPPAPLSSSSDFFGGPSEPPVPSTSNFAAPDTVPNVSLTMDSLSTSGGLLAGTSSSTEGKGGVGGTMADRALQNLMGSIDSFGITGKAATPSNPFDSNNNLFGNATLGEIKSAKVTEKKPVMNAPPGPGALVMSTNQGGNWGGFGRGLQHQPSQSLGGMGGTMQQPPQYSMSGGYPQQQPQMGLQQPQLGIQQPMMGMQPQMGMMQGQQPPMQQQGYGVPPPYGQQPQMQQQNQWGTPFY
ncbi:hypothetical protein ACHAXA_011443 [Cyclostephanos tholiformis]|uniref:Uncharacterized protein n=1 Tax=Cyclostephanos tholiformis TaxID=382380 RepID=A0ABD3RVX0_9STRA